jgi:hypothetical protein
MTSFFALVSNIVALLLVTIHAQEGIQTKHMMEFDTIHDMPNFHFHDDETDRSYSKVESGITFSRNIVSLPSGGKFHSSLERNMKAS